MKYEEARPLIKSGDLLAWTHKPWSSLYDLKIQLVRFFTRSEYSHVAIAWVIGERVFVIEAVIPLIRIYPLSKLGNFYWLPMDVKWNKETEALALSKIGERYSTFDAIKAYFTKLEYDSRWECAEFVAKVLEYEGIDLGTEYIPSLIVEKAMLLGKPLNLVTQ